jgi:hypothetical protein
LDLVKHLDLEKLLMWTARIRESWGSLEFEAQDAGELLEILSKLGLILTGVQELIDAGIRPRDVQIVGADPPIKMRIHLRKKHR